MRTKIFFWIAAGLLFFASCAEEMSNESRLPANADEVPLTDAELQVLYQMRGGDNKVSVEEIDLLANDVIGFLDGEPLVKSGASRQIASVTPLATGKKQEITVKSSKGEKTVSIPDTLAYVINFADGAGYTIVAADTRVETPVLAMVPSGTFEYETDHAGLGVFLEGAEYYIMRSIIEAEQRKDSLLSEISAKLSAADLDEPATKGYDFVIVSSEVIYSGSWIPNITKKPLIPVEWGQGDEYVEPFWDNVRFNQTCGTCPAGCVAVALAHIMSYWKYPTSINGVNFNWSEMNQYTGFHSFAHHGYNAWSDEVNDAPAPVQAQYASLMERIGVNVGMVYGCNGSGANSDVAIDYLKDIGYSGGTKKTYGYNSVVSSLNSNRPVYARGNINSNGTGGHAWVIDGYMETEKTIILELVVSGRPPITPGGEYANFVYLGNNLWKGTLNKKEYANWLHNNWGFSGDGNGHFLEGCFDAKAASLENPNANVHTHNFQYNNEIYVDLRH